MLRDPGGDEGVRRPPPWWERGLVVVLSASGGERARAGGRRAQYAVRGRASAVGTRAREQRERVPGERQERCERAQVQPQAERDAPAQERAERPRWRRRCVPAAAAAAAAADRSAEDEDGDGEHNGGDGDYAFHFFGLSLSQELRFLLPTLVVRRFAGRWHGGGGDSASRRLQGDSTRRSGLEGGGRTLRTMGLSIDLVPLWRVRMQPCEPFGKQR